jgi:hypothetical protein
MATFDNLPASRPAPRRPKNAPVFCVGWRAFVHWPLRGPQTPGPVPLIDGNGQPLDNDLIDGQQVEILSWRPRSREGLVYQVRRTADGKELWIGAQYLRKQAMAEPVEEPLVRSAQR